VGFKPATELRDCLQIRKSSFLYPEEELGKGSTCAFIALHQKMLELDQVAVVWAQLSASLPPRLAVLVAQEEEVDDVGQLVPPGMNLIYMPFAEDFRNTEEEVFAQRGAPPELADSEMVAAAQRVIQAVQLEDFNCRDVENPALQRHYVTLEALALDFDKDQALPEVQDYTLPDKEGMKRAAKVFENFKAEVFGAAHDQEEAEENMASQAKAQAGAKRKADSLSTSSQVVQEIDWNRHVDDGTLAKLTVDKLKAYCIANKVPTSSANKATLIERIIDHVRKQRV